MVKLFDILDYKMVSLLSVIPFELLVRVKINRVYQDMIMHMVSICVGCHDKTKVSTCQFLDGLVANAVDFLWCQLVFRRKRLNQVVGMDFGLLDLLAVVSRIVEPIIVSEVGLIHLHHLLITRKNQIVPHAKIRNQLQLLRLFRIENILDEALAVLGAVNRKMLSDYHKTPSAAGTLC